MSETPTATGILGPQLRRLRQARGLTLDALAEAVGLDKGYLSRLERGQKAPSIATLLRLAGSLGVSVAELLGETLPADAVRITRASRRRAAPMQMLTEGSGPLAAFLIHPPAEFAEEGAQDHGGQELLYVLEGRIELAFADRSLQLSAGDAAEFAGHLPHRLRRIGDAPATALVAVARD
ncbi:helix-turn-helix transcriptional regulator [Belnapia sp. T6]|uniref:Helix-turn-helix transcriptional regulator n=1 Tax=Belnapia mucosa TaxID=2804532 RepID=A0ABS1V921_9PROT|nr:XRE family transcriptional regulator [Belnapia mucosa]MBL6458160.1 helix-turn-helix transcriptional regulator [Belnapia mucosa]